MLALSRPLFSTTYAWPLENLFSQNLDPNHISAEVEASSYHSLLQFSTYDQIHQDFILATSTSSRGVVNDNDIKATPLKQMARKLNHNASERDRRKKVNDLYTFLRSLLPTSSDQKKKLSIPGTISRALKYIPELQKEVETLIHKKEKLFLCSSSVNGVREQEHHDIKNHDAKYDMLQTVSTVVPSITILDEKEVVIQLISSSDHLNNNKAIGFLSKAMEHLEEDGFVLLNATTFEGYGDKRFLNTLHLQMQGDYKIEAERLTKKLFYIYQQSL